MSKKSALRSAYMRERRRIQNYISKRKRWGFQSEFKMPDMPKKITEGSIRRLKNITAEKLRSFESIFVSPQGEVTYGEHWKLTKAYKEVRKAERRKAKLQGSSYKGPYGKQKPKMSDVIFNTVKDTLSMLPDNVEQYMKNVLNQAVREVGREEVAKIMQDLAEEGKPFSVETLYSDRAAARYGSQLLSRLGFSGQYQSDLQEMLDEYDTYDYELAAGDYD